MRASIVPTLLLTAAGLAAGSGAAAAQSFLPPEPGSPAYQGLALAAEETLEIAVAAHVDGSAHSNGDLELAEAATVTGDVTAHAFLEVEGVVAGAAVEGAALVALPAPYDETAGRSLAGRVFEGSVVFSADETVDDVVFVAGDARFQGALAGTGTVIATGDVVLEKLPQGAPAAAPGDRHVLVALGSVVIEAGRPFRGLIVAGREVELEEGAALSGAAVAHRGLFLEEGVGVTFEVFE